VTPATPSSVLRIFRGRSALQDPADTLGAQRLERAVGEDLLYLAERGAERPGEDLERTQALLQLGDLDGKLRGAGVEGRDADLELIRPCGEAGDFVCNRKAVTAEITAPTRIKVSRAMYISSATVSRLHATLQTSDRC
jgi:hypothetical protein